MKYIAKSLPALLIALSIASQGITEDAKVENDASGIIHYGKETMDSLNGTGRVTLEGTTVQNLLKVNGSLFAHKATIGTLSVGGHAHLVKSTVLGKSDVGGFLHAEKSNFRRKIILAGQKLSLEKCRAGSIFVKKSYIPFSTQTIELSKKSVVKGKITFESGKGRIILRDKSRLLGKVRGCKIEQYKQKK